MQRPGLNSHSQKRTSLNLHTASVPQPPTIFACLTGTGCAPFADYALIGVINRLDRVVFKSDSCGELRFLYRLEYEKDKRASRLPMTINVVFIYRIRTNQLG